jgi:hypothetical protein
MSMNICWVISPVLLITEEQNRAFELDNSTYVGCILSLLSDQRCDVYVKYSVACEVWEALDCKYAESDAGHELYVNDQYHNYRMVDDRPIVEQAHEIQLLVGELAHFNCVLPDKFMFSGIIAKLPPSWRSFVTTLKHKKEVMTFESLISTLDVEEKERFKDVPCSCPLDGGGPSNANVMEDKSGGNKNKNRKGKAKQNTEFKKKKNLADLACFVCGEPGYIARKCCNRKGKKAGGQKSANVTVSEAGGSEYEPKILLACQSTNWWLYTGTNVHVCSDLNLFSSYQTTDSCSIWQLLHLDVHGVGTVDLKLISGKTLFEECVACSWNK